MKIMLNHSSAVEREETPHTINPTPKKALKVNRCLAVALKRRAESVINDRSIDADSRAIIRYALETTDPWLAELLSRVDAGEAIMETVDFSQEPHTISEDRSEEKIEALMDMICRAGDEPQTKSAALLVLMATVENSTHPKALANIAKHLAFTRCGELNLYGIVDAQIPMIEGELFAGGVPLV
jgi:hypothetical protein